MTQPPPIERHASWAPVVAGGLLTIAGLSAGIGFQLVRNARENESQNIRNDSTIDCQAPTDENVSKCHRLSDLASDYDAFGRLELVSFIAGGLALVGTGTYFLVARPDRTTTVSSARSPVRFGADLTKHSGRMELTVDF